MMAAIDRFSSAAGEQVPVLLRKAAAIQAYLESR